MSVFKNSYSDLLLWLARDFKAITDPDLPDNPGEQSSHQDFYIKASDWQQNWVFEKDTGPPFKRLHIHLSVTQLGDLSTATAQT